VRKIERFLLYQENILSCKYKNVFFFLLLLTSNFYIHICWYFRNVCNFL